MTDHNEQHLLTGAYALNALNDQDKAGFEEYLEGSEEARAEVAALSDTAVQLALTSEPVAPSPQLKASLMAAIRSTPQRGPERAAAESVSTAAPQAAVHAVPSPSPALRKAQSRWFTRPVTILAAAAAAVALFAGGNWLGQSNVNNNTAVQAQATALVQLSAAGDAQRASSTVAGGGTATVIWSLSQRRSAVVIDKLPALAAGKTYQLWYIDASGAKPAGTFESSDGGTTWHMLDGAMSAGDTIGVTVEPDGGSSKPTTKPIVAIATA